MRVATVFLLGGLVVATGCSGEPERPKIIVLGFDGAGWETIDPLIDAGERPGPGVRNGRRPR